MIQQGCFVYLDIAG